MDIILLVLYAIMIYMIIRMFAMRKINRKMDKVIQLVKILEDKEAFMQMADEDIRNAATEMEKTKFQILKLWGMCHHGMYDGFDELLSEIRPEALIGTKTTNDDSFFYLFLAVPNILQAAGREEEMETLLHKIEENREMYEGRLDYQIAMNCMRYYRHEDDRGFAFFASVMDGDYGQYTYNRQLIGLYKQTVASMLLEQYEEKQDHDHYEEMKSICEEFQQTRIGEMWLQNLNIHLPGAEAEKAEEEQTSSEVKEEENEEKTEETSEDASAEMTDLSAGSESGTSFVGADEKPEEKE